MTANEKDDDVGPVQLPKGKVIAKKWKIINKLGEGGCGAVYKVRNIQNTTEYAALKVESNFVSGGSVLKLEVQILRRLEGRSNVAQLIQSGKKSTYSYMVMTLLGDSLNTLLKKLNRQASLSTQTRVGINALYGIKQLHDIGFIHRDLKPANIAVGRNGTNQARFLHILDFGLAREFIIKEDCQLKIRRPRQRALFRGTTRYCSIATHERKEQGRVDDLWSLLYMLAEMRGTLPWAARTGKDEILEMKKATEPDMILENSPVQFVAVAELLKTYNYFSRPDYLRIFALFNEIMECGKFKWTDPWDWETKMMVLMTESKENVMGKGILGSREGNITSLNVLKSTTGAGTPSSKEVLIDPENPFPQSLFDHKPFDF